MKEIKIISKLDCVFLSYLLCNKTFSRFLVIKTWFNLISLFHYTPILSLKLDDSLNFMSSSRLHFSKNEGVLTSL